MRKTYTVFAVDYSSGMNSKSIAKMHSLGSFDNEQEAEDWLERKTLAANLVVMGEFKRHFIILPTYEK